MNLLVCIPTLTGREEYLANCVAGYKAHTPCELELAITHDEPTCGLGWQRAIDRALAHGLQPNVIHFSNDDIVVGEGWFDPMLEAVEFGCVPAPRIEPAGYYLGDPMPDPVPMPPAGDPTSDRGYFYSDLPENQPTADWQRVDHGALPFCSMWQWEQLGPFIPSHFGTDKWFYHRARTLGIPIVARQRAVIYNYAPQIGRARGEWTEQDFLDFDLTVAYPMYLAGTLGITQQHPLRETATGLKLVRDWRARTFG